MKKIFQEKRQSNLSLQLYLKLIMYVHKYIIIFAYFLNVENYESVIKN